ncbi:MAG: hypothetical protein GX326_01575 [Clostridiaceae bacterium]|nr:hypothetical protein [Clostridiaceae bacterium]
MNWQRYYKFFNYLNIAEADYFATPEKATQAISTYNRALRMLKNNKDQTEAIKLIQTIADDYPMFPEPSHIYGIHLAEQGEYKEALEYLKRVSLLDITDEMANMLQEQFVVIERELKAERSSARTQTQKTKETPQNKKASLGSVLQKAPKHHNKESLSKSEINAINKKLGNEDPSDLSEEIARENRVSDRRFLISVFVVAVLVISIFYFVIRPAVVNRLDGGQTVNQLQWLENEITDRAKDDPEINKLLNDYLSEFSDESDK